MSRLAVNAMGGQRAHIRDRKPLGANWKMLHLLQKS